MTPAPPVDTAARTEAFITRWHNAGGTELANYQLFLTELIALLDLPPPDPAGPDPAQNAYVFERHVQFQHPDGSTSSGRIDLYRRGCLVCEAKQSGLALPSTAWDAAMLRAHAQASNYARALPAAEGRPPFVLVTDVGRHLGVYADFTRSGATYIPFPDALSHRIALTDLRDPEIRERLRGIWLDPLALDPARQSARVTRQISAKLAELARSLEVGPNRQAAETVAGFLMRCLFTMFAEDVGLLPKASFTTLLEDMRADPAHLPHLLNQLWADMDRGSAFSPVLRAPLPRFNGGLFADPTALALTPAQLELLIDAASADWRAVEPAIFGTLLERALDPIERHKLGAHYTPRAYVERLVLPTVINPLREEWANTQASAYRLDQDGRRDQAIAAVRGFHRRLCTVRVLDPACGSGNFLYVTLEHLKRLEGEVLAALAGLGDTQQKLELEGGTVSPEQMLGLETNPRAARIAETVLWIGYLQWHFRTFARTPPREPLLADAHNITCRDAVLAWDDLDYLRDDQGRPITRWDGRTVKPHPLTGEPVPDETARVPVERLINPRPAPWPAAEFVVGNPPFIGAKYMRSALGDGYAEALWRVYPEVAESADYVMFWWHRAAQLTRSGAVRRFGLITTNSLRQTFNRRVLAAELTARPPLTLAFAIPDHPWVDTADGAAVRIAMTVGTAGEGPGLLQSVIAERSAGGEGLDVTLDRRTGVIAADLSVGADVGAAVALQANGGISSPGVKLHGAGFIVTREQAEALGLGRIPGLERHIREYRNGRDLAARPRDVLVIDLFGLDAGAVRDRFPEVYQWVLERVKPERDQNRRATYRDNWWLFGEPRAELRPALAGLSRYISTVVTSKHRFFAFLGEHVLPDDALIAITADDAHALGVLSSRAHCLWAFHSGSTLEDRPRYIKTRCFETFPFPPADADPHGRVAALAEQIDAHRQRQQALHPDLTLTGLYNLLERLRQIAAQTAQPPDGAFAPSATFDGAGAANAAKVTEPNPQPTAQPTTTAAPLTPAERTLHDRGLVSVLAQLHDELDAAVLTAYGWADLIPPLVGAPGGTTPLPDKPAALAAAEEALLTRLLALNAQRAADEQRGLVRWLRPAWQQPAAGLVSADAAPTDREPTAATPTPASGARQPWPKALPAQFQAVRDCLAGLPAPATPTQVARCFSRAPVTKVSELLETLAALGQVQQPETGRYW